MISEKINQIEEDIDLLKKSMEIISSLVKEQETSINNIEDEINKSYNDTKYSISKIEKSYEYKSSYYIYLSVLGAIISYFLF